MTFSHDRKYFNATDYAIFATSLIIPILIGLYFTFISKKKPATVSEYLVGNRNMKFFPVVMSLAASCISAGQMIGPVSEVYFYGMQLILKTLTMVISSCLFAALYLPPFYNLNIISTFEYLQRRFDYKVRLLGSILFLIKNVFHMTIWIYAPSVMFEQVSGIDSHILIPIFSGLCIFYTFGGVHSVIWADTFQILVMLLGMIIIVVVGMYDVGKIGKIFEINQQGNRLHVFDFNPDPRLRQSFWHLMIGDTIGMLGFFTSSQFVVQRCVSLSTLFKSKMAVIIQSIIGATAIAFGCYLGLLLYSAFHDCDPITANKISKPDQLLPYFIMNLKNRIPGMTSVVISIAFCAALSSISSGLNSASGVILIDFIQPLSKRPITDAQGSMYMKIITVLMGLLYTGMTYTIHDSNNVIYTAISLVSISLGASLGIFTLGVFLPWANSNGAFVGGIAGGIVVAWMSIGSQISSAGKKALSSKLPLSIENCENFTTTNVANQTFGMKTNSDLGEPFILYTISFYYYALVGALTAITVGMIVSYLTGLNKPEETDQNLFSPVIKKYLRRNNVNSYEMTGTMMK